MIIKFEEYKGLHKKGVPDQQILDTILLLIEMKHLPQHIEGCCTLSDYIQNIDRVREYWAFIEPKYKEFIATLKEEGIDERVISYANVSFFANYLYQAQKASKSLDLLYKAVREANKAPESLNYKYALYDILENVIKADQNKAEQKTGDEAQDIE